MKINLPNPTDYLNKEDEFWEQLELAIYHAKKSWEKTKRKYTSEDIEKGNYPWIVFRQLPQIESAVETVDPDREEQQEISIEINEL